MPLRIPDHGYTGVNISMLTYKDFSTRSEFVKYLGLYHGDRHNTDPDFHKILAISPAYYQHELDSLLANLDYIRLHWNNQSINDIEKSVAKHGQKQLDIMQAQKNEKIAAGYDPAAAMYRINMCPPDSVFVDLARDIGLESAVARYHVQFPGEVTVWHTDIYSPAHEFLQISPKVNDQDIGKDQNIRRVLIALQDWDWGQFLLFGKTPWINWDAGDVIFWNYGVPHGGANVGFNPRISVSITGKVSDKFERLCHG